MRNRAWAIVCCVVSLAPAIAYAEGDGLLAFLAVDQGYWQAWVAELDGSNGRPVTRSPGDKTRISWFPDGKRLLVNSQDGRLSVAEVASGKETPLAESPVGMVDAVLSPDGRRIAYSLSPTDSRDKNDIFVFDIAAQKPRRVVAISGLQDEPCWAADGQTIYFSGGDGRTEHDLFALDLASGSTEQLTAAANYHMECSTIPDGRVVFSSNRSGHYDIYSIDPEDATTLVRWTNAESLDATPSWMPGGAIVFSSTRTRPRNLWTVDSPGGTPRQLTSHKEGARGPVVHPGASR